jgi:6-phosphogluconate dehydrogenase
MKKMNLKKEIGLVGLGKMGRNLALNLLDHGWRVTAYNRTASVTKKLAAESGAKAAYSLGELAEQLSPPRLVWVMVPAGKAVDEVIFGQGGLSEHLERGDVLIDGGNSKYTHTLRRAEKLKKAGIEFMDVGVSGGPTGARRGACLMIGGEKKLFKQYETLFANLAVDEGYGHMGRVGSGHFVKMVHNGIEYGMMQAMAEGFDLLHRGGEFNSLDLAQIARVYNHGSVIESRLMDWMRQAYERFGSELEGVSGSAQASGEGEWTVEAAKRRGVPVKVIEKALKARFKSQKEPNYQGQVIQALRHAFGGHALS